MSVSIREVAAHAGVSLGTVSKVLNDAAGAQIAPATREKVRASARALSYHPSAVARAMVRKQMDTIGVVLPPGQASPIRSPFFAALFDSVLQAAAQQGQNVTLFTGHAWRDATHSLPVYRDGRCDGLILFYQPETSDIVTALLDADMPLVLLSDVRDDPRATCVDVDNVGAARAMTAHLLSLGHRRIGLLCGAVTLNYVAPRIDGCRQAVVSSGLPWDDALVKTFFYGQEDTALQALLDLPEARRPTALFCFGDDLAAHTLQLLAERGIRVPDDLSVVGFNDDGAALHSYPSLTTVRQPYLELGQAAVHLLREQIRDIDTRGERRILPVEIVPRNSSVRIVT